MLKLRHCGKVYELSSILETTLENFQKEVHLLTDILPSKQKIKFGFPQKELEITTEMLSKTLNELGVRSRSIIDVTTGEFKVSSTRALVSCNQINIDADNSCLYNSISMLCEGKMRSDDLRQICYHIIKENPDVYDEATLGEPRDSYLSDVLDIRRWGGYIEIGILADYYNVEIAICYVSENNIMFVNPSKSNERIYILYTGQHYDGLVFKNGLSEEIRKVSTNDEYSLILAKEFMNVKNVGGDYSLSCGQR